MSDYFQVEEGDWHRVKRRGHKNACCDCGLVHRFYYRVGKDGGIEFKATVDRRATAAVRRAFKFEKDEE